MTVSAAESRGEKRTRALELTVRRRGCPLRFRGRPTSARSFPSAPSSPARSFLATWPTSPSRFRSSRCSRLDAPCRLPLMNQADSDVCLGLHPRSHPPHLIHLPASGAEPAALRHHCDDFSRLLLGRVRRGFLRALRLRLPGSCRRSK